MGTDEAFTDWASSGRGADRLDVVAHGFQLFVDGHGLTVTRTGRAVSQRPFVGQAWFSKIVS